jgi:hypothetical protein
MLSQMTDASVITNISYLRHGIVDHDGGFHHLTSHFLFGLGDMHLSPILFPRKMEESLSLREAPCPCDNINTLQA